MDFSHTDLFHTDPKDFKDGYAASRLRGPHVYPFFGNAYAQHHRVIGEADVAKRQIFKIFKIRVRKKSVRVRKKNIRVK